MPSESSSQKRLFGIIRGLQKGTVSPDSVSGEAKHIAKEVTPVQADHFAKTKEKGLPEHKSAQMDKEAAALSKLARTVVDSYVSIH